MNVIYARPMIRARRKVSSRRDRIWGRIFRKLTKDTSHPARGRRPYIRWRWLAWASSAKKPKVWRTPGYNRDRGARSVGRFRVTSKTPFLSTNSAEEIELRSNPKRGACRRSNEYEGLNGGRFRVTSKTPFLSTNSAEEIELRSNPKRGACRRSNEYEGLNGGRDRTRTCD